MRVRRGQQLEACERAVAAAVVDEEDFVRPAEVARDPASSACSGATFSSSS